MLIKLNDVQMDKVDILETLRSLLEEAGIIEGKDYVLSLQGPTVIGTVGGYKKLTSLDEVAKKKMKTLGVQILVWYRFVWLIECWGRIFIRPFIFLSRGLNLY